MQDVACIMFDYGVGIFYLVLSKDHVIDKLRNLTKSPWSKFLLHLIPNNGLLVYPNQQ
jgi:hypothetical protein